MPNTNYSRSDKDDNNYYNNCYEGSNNVQDDDFCDECGEPEDDCQCDDNGQSDSEECEQNITLPGDLDYKVWDFDPIEATRCVTPSDKDLHFAKLFVHKAIRVHKIYLAVSKAARRLEAKECFAGIYNCDGRLVATTKDISCEFKCAGIAALELECRVWLKPGAYTVALLLNGCDMPALWCAPCGPVDFPRSYGAINLFYDIDGCYTCLPKKTPECDLDASKAPYWVALA